jgi:hypothetical protein
MATGVTQAIGVTAIGPGSRVTAVLAAGANNNLTPSGQAIQAIGMIDLDSTAGVANITGLAAGYDGQRITLRLTTASAVTLNNANGGSSASNQFSGTGDSVLAQGLAIDIVYYAGSVNKWVFVP